MDPITLIQRLFRVSFAGREALQKAVTNSAWLLADKMVRMVVGLVISTWMARYLGPEQFGIFNYAISIVLIFSTLASLGIDSIIVRDIVRDPDKTPEILGTAFVLRLAGAACSLFLAIGAILLIRPADSLTHWLVGITAAGMIAQAFDAIDFWFQAELQSKYPILAKNIAFLAISIVKIALILSGAPLIAFAWAGFAELLLGACGLVLAYRLRGKHITDWRKSSSRAISLLRNGWPLVLSGFTIYLQARFDQVMLREMVGAGELGQFSAALVLIEFFGFIPMIVQGSASPAVTLAKTQDETMYLTRMLNIYRLMSMLFIAVAIPIAAYGKVFVRIMYGSEYQQAGSLLGLFALRLFFANFGVAKSMYILNENLFRYSLLTAAIGTAVNIALNLFFIPRYGAVGAVWSMIISFSVTVFAIDIFVPRMRNNLRLMVYAVCTPWRFKLS
ncbi:MAG: flippase [Nitrospirota bacterium]|nr:flippase [Nitrospirota bacterium]